MDFNALIGALIDQIIAVWSAPVPFLVALAFFGWLILLAVRQHYEERIAAKDATIQHKEGLIQEYKEKLSGATPEAARARLDALEDRLEAIRPRKLTAEQRHRMATELEMFRGSRAELAVDAMSVEAATLSKSLELAFNAAGWHATTSVGLGFGARNSPPSGIGLEVQNASDPTDGQRAIAAALRAVGLKFDLVKTGSPKVDRDGSPMQIISLTNKADD